MKCFEIIEKKILKEADLERFCAISRFKKEKIVFTNGCFDVVHFGHISYLTRAADLGTKLIVGLNSDSSVKRLKGKQRPINGEMERAMLLASLEFVDAVVIFNENTPYNLISQIKPNILVKGGDYNPEEIVGYDVVKSDGGEVLSLNFVEGYSSTEIIKELKV